MPGMEISELDRVRTRIEFHHAGKILHAAPVAGLLLDDLLSIHQQRAAVHFQKKCVSPLVGNVHPAFVFDRRVMLGLAQTLEVKILNVPGPLRFHLRAVQPFPHLTAIQRVAKRTRHPRILQQVMGDALNVLP